MPKVRVTQITPRKNTSLNQSALEALVTSNERCQSKSTQSQSQSTPKLKEQQKTNKKRCKQEMLHKRNTRVMTNTKNSEERQERK